MEKIENSNKLENKEGLHKDRDKYAHLKATVEDNNQETNPKEDMLNNYKTRIKSFLNKYCDNTIGDFIFRTKIFLEYDEDHAFIFILSNCLIFTHLFDDNETEFKSNPILYIIKFQQIYFYDLQVNQNDGNYINLQFYENDFLNKSIL